MDKKASARLKTADPPHTPMPGLPEQGDRPHWVVQLRPHELAIEDVEVQLFHQLPLAADRVEDLQEQGPEELLGGIKGRPVLA